MTAPTPSPDAHSPSAAHWNRVYTEKSPTAVSWYQPAPTLSLELIDAAARPPLTVLDAGGGASALVDRLVARPDVQVIVIDIAARAFDHARSRLGAPADRVRWIEADITGPLSGLADTSVDIWHDRAVFHFLTTPEARLAYMRNLARILRPHGTAIIATFAPDGPEKCSGLPVCRHDAASIVAEAQRSGRPFELMDSRREQHTTPWGSLQSFVYAVLRSARTGN